MRCHFCAVQDTRVVDSRLVSEGDQVRWRRSCVSCKERFTTYDVAELTLPKIIKRDGARESFDEIKLRSGMLRALEKRAVTGEVIEVAISRIKKTMPAMDVREIPADEVGEVVVKELRALDHVGFVRFASVYRRFQDVNEFTEMIESMQNK